VQDIFLHSSHPYTLGLMRCVPRLDTTKINSYLQPIRGRVPSRKALPPGCAFEPRCDFARPVCSQQRIEMREVRPGHWSRCLFAEEIIDQGKELIEDRAALLKDLTIPPDQKPILTLENARTYYRAPSKGLLLGEKQYVRAVDDVSLAAMPGKTFGIVGESGCGKSTLVKTIIGLEAPTGGEMEFMGIDITEPVGKRGIDLIKNLQMVFQNPDSTLNPSFSVGYQIARPLRRFKTIPRNQVRGEVIRLLNMMKLGENYYNRLPRQLSGGEKQRVAIARAIAAQPKLVLCDEPVSALDVSVQAAVLNLLLEIQQELGTTLVFIAHDLSVVRFFCDHLAVMYLGQIAEIGPAEAIYQPPYHPYTEALLSAVPIPDPRAEQKHIRLSGTVPSALNPPTGCRFHTRCPRRAMLPDGGKICETENPPERRDTDEHHIYCHIPLEELRKMDAVVKIEKEGPHAG
jgi:peptide/nickel transport system ATP-binding protein